MPPVNPALAHGSLSGPGGLEVSDLLAPGESVDPLATANVGFVLHLCPVPPAENLSSS